MQEWMFVSWIRCYRGAQHFQPHKPKSIHPWKVRTTKWQNGKINNKTRNNKTTKSKWIRTKWMADDNGRSWLRHLRGFSADSEMTRCFIQMIGFNLIGISHKHNISIWEGMAMDSLKFHLGLPCPTLLQPAGGSPAAGPPLKRPYGCFSGGLPAGWAACRPCSTPLDTQRRKPMLVHSVVVSVWPGIQRCVRRLRRFPKCKDAVHLPTPSPAWLCLLAIKPFIL
jgi:hypothetical protein